MNVVNQKIIDAVIAKAEKVCPGSLELIGVYGSVATGDEYAKSDLDLLILIKDDEGWQLGTGMLLEDSGIAYDIYCTRWEWMRGDAECHHAQISKLMDSRVVYIKNQEAYDELLRLRNQAKAFLQTDARFERVDEQIKQAKIYYAEACLADSLSRVRMNAAGVIVSLLSAIMLYHGSYFRRGTKRIFEELAQFPLDEQFLDNMRRIPASKDEAELRELTKELILYVTAYTARKKECTQPCAENLSGTYEEIYSNWRNKVEEAANNNDTYSAFMNMCFLQNMIDEIASEVDIGSFDLMESYDPENLHNNTHLYDRFLAEYETVYEKAGIRVNRFANVDEFFASYTETKSV